MSNSNPITEIRGLAERNCKTMFRQFMQCEVSFLGEGCLIDEYINIEYTALEIAMEDKAIGFTKDEFYAYCKGLVVARIDYVADNHPVIKPQAHLAVPAFLMNIISQIGLANDATLGISVTPKTVDEKFIVKENAKEGQITVAKAQEISLRLENIKSYACGFGYSNDKKGSWDFMTMQLIENEVCRHDATAHPVYALMASVVGTHLISSVLNPLVTYGSTALFKDLLWQLKSI